MATKHTTENFLPFISGRATKPCGCIYERYGSQEMNLAGTQTHPRITHVRVIDCPKHAAVDDLLAAAKQVERWFEKWPSYKPNQSHEHYDSEQGPEQSLRALFSAIAKAEKGA